MVKREKDMIKEIKEQMRVEKAQLSFCIFSGRKSLKEKPGFALKLL